MRTKSDILFGYFILACFLFILGHGFVYGDKEQNREQSTSNNPEKDLALPPDLTKNISPNAQKLAAEVWPKVKRVLPGLDKYCESLKVNSISDYLDMPDKEYRKITIEIVVPDNGGDIPQEYFAIGQHCYIDIPYDGESVSVAKKSCKSTLLDKDISENGYDNSGELILNLK